MRETNQPLPRTFLHLQKNTKVYQSKCNKCFWIYIYDHFSFLDATQQITNISEFEVKYRLASCALSALLLVHSQTGILCLKRLVACSFSTDWHLVACSFTLPFIYMHVRWVCVFTCITCFTLPFIKSWCNSRSKVVDIIMAEHLAPPPSQL